MSHKKILKSPKPSSLNSEIFSPVSLHVSPAAASPQKNLTGLPRTVRDIAADVYNTVQRWNALTAHGTGLLKQIALLKTDADIEHPDGLEVLCESLAEAITAMDVLVGNLRLCSQQLCASGMLHRSAEPLFTSWPIDRFGRVGGAISDAYSQELELKRSVVENVPHVRDRHRLMWYAACWAHQPHVGAGADTLLEGLLLETGHRAVA